MNFFRSQIVPIFTIIIALFGLVVVSARSFIGTDLSAPAPIESVYFTSQSQSQPPTSSLTPNINH